MNNIFLREVFSEIAKDFEKENGFPYITLIVVLVVIGLVILLMYFFRKSIDNFLRISDAESYVNKNGSSSYGTSISRTQSSKVISDDPEKTTNMKTINLPKKAKKGE